MKKEYIQPKAKEIKIELLSMVATSLEMGGSTSDSEMTGGNDAKDEMDFDW